jgi:molecular chaperone Hsp33
LGRIELEAILLEDGNAEVVCQFCNEPYVFKGEQLQELLTKI